MVTLEAVRAALRASWGPDTCYPDARKAWGSDNPARDQCGMTALVIQDLLGGELIIGEVQVDARKVSNHYRNRLPDGTEVDLTGDQFFAHEVVVNSHTVLRPPDAPRRHRAQYELLKERVLDRLTFPSTTPPQ